MKKSAAFPVRAAALTLAALASATAAHAVDTFDLASNLLTLQAVTTGGQTYYNARVNIGGYSQLSENAGAPVSDTFDSATNMLTMGSVLAGDKTYTNVRVHVDAYSIASVGTPLPQDVMRSQAMQHINDIRQQCGHTQSFTEVPVLDGAASAHMNYMLVNKDFSVTEIAGKPGYTASSVNQQIGATGYKYISLPEFSPIPLGATGAQWVDSVLSTTLGAARLLQAREAGLSFAPYPSENPTAMLGYGFFGTLSMTPLNMQRALLTYPCDGMTGVAPRNSTGNAMVNNADEASTVGALSAATTGTPISFVSSYTQTIQLKSVSLTDASGASIPVQWFDVATAGLNTGYAVVLPNQPLQDNTTYTVNALLNEFAVGATLTNKVVKFSFTTGSAVVYPLP